MFPAPNVLPRVWGLGLIYSGFFGDCHVVFVTSDDRASVHRRRYMLFVDLGKNGWMSGHTQEGCRNGRCHCHQGCSEGGLETNAVLRGDNRSPKSTNRCLIPPFCARVNFTSAPSPHQCNVFTKRHIGFETSQKTLHWKRILKRMLRCSLLRTITTNK